MDIKSERVLLSNRDVLTAIIKGKSSAVQKDILESNLNLTDAVLFAHTNMWLCNCP